MRVTKTISKTFAISKTFVILQFIRIFHLITGYSILTEIIRNVIIDNFGQFFRQFYRE